MYSFIDYSFSITQLIIMAILLLAVIIQLSVYIFIYAKLITYKKKIKKGKIQFNTEFPSVSVVVCAKNESENLSNLLPSILEQDYPSFEVIVINDGSNDESEDVLVVLKTKYPQLKTTFVPQAAKYIDSKKMAVVLGIKAAKNDILLFTDADCEPKSNKWIEKMVRNFDGNTEIVLGYGAYREKKGLLNYLIGYDTLFIAIQYLSWTLAKVPYMGVGRNMAYKKSLFYKTNGFASHLHLQSGDDDLFINEAANSNNTKIEIDPESVTQSEPENHFKTWLNQKQRHLSTSSYYKWKGKLAIGIEIFSRGLFYASIIALCVLIQDYHTYIILGSIFLIRFIIQAVIINYAASTFKNRTYYSSILLFDIILPLLSLFLFARNILRKKQRYKWK